MEAQVYCGKCGKKLEVADFGKGKQTECVRCGINVPVPSGKPSSSQLRLFCSQCGGRLSAPAEHAGEDMICPSCRFSISLPLLETSEQEAGDTQPLLPAVHKGDTDPVGLALADMGKPDTEQPTEPEAGVVRAETRAIDEAAEPASPGEPSPLGRPQRTDTRPVAMDSPPCTDTRPVSGATPPGSVEPAEEVSAATLEDGRARWMSSLLDQFVEKHSGEWKTGDLIELSERLSRAGYRYLDIVALNTELQKKRDAYHEKTGANLEKLGENGLVGKFVDDHRGRWNDKHLGELMKQIKTAGLWPVKLPFLNKLLEKHRQPWKVKMASNLKRLVKDGMLKEYIESRSGGWTQEGWQDLMKQLDQKGYLPYDPTAVAMALRRELTLCARGNLARLQKDGLLSEFVKEHKGDWTREDLQKLLRRIEKEGYAPVVSLGAALDAERQRWTEGSTEAT